MQSYMENMIPGIRTPSPMPGGYETSGGVVLLQQGKLLDQSDLRMLHLSLLMMGQQPAL